MKSRKSGKPEISVSSVSSVSSTSSISSVSSISSPPSPSCLSVINTAVCAVLIALVRAYKVTLSPLLGDCCRFEPTCSAYCIEALRAHGALKGVWLTLKRLGRCRPFGPSGYDPVPPKERSL